MTTTGNPKTPPAMAPHHRSRSPRIEFPHRERFSLAPSRRKCIFPAVNTPVQRSRNNSENWPPDNALCVKPNSPYSDANTSPPLCKSAFKSKRGGSLSLPPRPPVPRPSPTLLHRDVENCQESQGNAKRKLNLEPLASAEALTNPPLLELDNGVKVIIRMRPSNQREESEEFVQIVEKISGDSLCLADQRFTFDQVAGTDTSQQTMFEMVGLPLVENCLQGFNSSIFAYGQTGSGKTYTMWGETQDLVTSQAPSEERGLTPRVFEHLFQRIKKEEKHNINKQLCFQCRCSFLEIYNEQITDLLEPFQKILQVREDTKIGVYVENLTEEYVSSVEDVFCLMLKGLGNRKVGSTSMNLESSRSHTLFTCVIESRCKSIADGVSSVRTSRMNLVDLAGSERQKLTGAVGERLKEAGNINRSLSQLGNLINILAEVSQTRKPRHIPYRDSRLTFLLQESLGGNAKLAMICTISPLSSCKNETLSTLRFAQHAKSIKNKAIINEDTENDVKLLREQIRQLKDELMRMKSNETQSGGTGIYSTSWNARRSYNLLRMSLKRPMTLPHTDTDTDEEMEIEEEVEACVKNLRHDDELVTMDLMLSVSKNGGLLHGELASILDDSEAGVTISSTNASVISNSLQQPQTNIPDKNPSGDQPEVIVSTGVEGQDLHTEVETGVLVTADVFFESQWQNEDKDVSSSFSFLVCNEMDLVKEPAQVALPGSTDEMYDNVLASEDIGNPNVCAVDQVVLGLPVTSSSELDCENHDAMSLIKNSEAAMIQNESGDVTQESCAEFLHMQQSQYTALNKYPTVQVHDSSSMDADFMTAQSNNMASFSTNDAHNLLCPPEGCLDLQQLGDKVKVADSCAAIDSEQDVSGDAPIEEETFESGSMNHSTSDIVLLGYTNYKVPCLMPPVLSISSHLAQDVLQSPVLSVSPRLLDDNKRIIGRSTYPLLAEDATLQAWPSEYENAQVVKSMAVRGNPGGEETKSKMLSLRSSLRSSKNLSSPTDRLAASLHRGLQILENHQRKISNNISFQNPESDKLKPKSVHDKSIQTSPVSSPEKALVPVQEPLGSVVAEGVGLSKAQSCDGSDWSIVAMEDPKTPLTGAKVQLNQNLEAILAGAIRRERAMEEALSRKNAEIEQLNRLVRQYKHERECNALLQQRREDKIARLESLMDGTIPTDAFLNEEWSCLLFEYKILQEKYDQHPDVTLANVRQQRLCEELEQYRNFYDLGERDALLGEICQFRSQLQSYVDAGTPRSAKQRRRSLTPRATSSHGHENLEGPSPVAVPEAFSTCCSLAVVENGRCEKCKEEKSQWAERENEWMSVLEELRVEVEEYRQLAEKRKQEIDGEWGCADEMKETLQMAMEGHARLLDQYAELQEKHISLLAKHRKIKEAMGDARKRAGKMGFLRGKWFEAQAAELTALKFEQEQERKVAREQIEGLQAQVRDTADAVEAAGELLVRLKEAEEAVLVAEDAAVLAEQDVDTLHREMEKLKRKHSTEMATLQQRLLEARLQKSKVCPMCVMAERVNFQFTEVEAEGAEAALEAEHLAAAEEEEEPSTLLHNEEESSLDMHDHYWYEEVHQQRNL